MDFVLFLVRLRPWFRGGSKGVQRGLVGGWLGPDPLNPQSTPNKSPIYPLDRVDITKLKGGKRKRREIRGKWKESVVSSRL